MPAKDIENFLTCKKRNWPGGLFAKLEALNGNFKDSDL
jgi:hypothetical protein